MRHAIFVLLTILFAVKASACSCMAAATVKEELTQADVVFAGVVESIEDPRGEWLDALPEQERLAAQEVPTDGSWRPQYGRKVTFRALQWWKNDNNITESVDLWTGYGGGDCGYPVEIGKSFIVYGHRDSRNQLGFGICGRTAALVCASGDLEELGEPIKTYETFDTKSLIEREQPYTAANWRPCIEPAVLIGARGLDMDRHCRFNVEGVITRDGTVRDFKIIKGPTLPRVCPDALDGQLTEQVAKWRFRPATFNGEPIETLLTSVSMREPMTEADHARQEKERAERKAKTKP
ncbi:MAG TPA: hypothetical protein VEK79_17610 [Thermoanaerobaculia bacterium]|nr:hypothetical protein [Thermoanaerobaculia bacterium]